jgi:hypothetical protein
MSLWLAAALLWAPAAGAASPSHALLWVPPADFTGWPRLDEALSRYGGLRLTAALSASQLTPEAKRVIEPWAAKGRLEVALRLEGDPLLPLIASLPAAPRPSDAADRLVLERERFREALGSVPAGFVPGAGALSAETASTLAGLGAAWAAVGDYGGADAWAAADRLVLAPCRAPRGSDPELSAESFQPGSETAPSVTVIDESDGLVPAGALLASLKALDRARPWGGWATVTTAASEARARARPSSALPAWPAWPGSLDAWTSGDWSKTAWALYGEAASAVGRYQNSGTADLKSLEAATEALHAAQANRFYRDAGAQKELRGRLVAVYRALRQTPPEALFSDASGGAGQDERTTDVHVEQGADWVEFANPAASLPREPERRLETLRVESSTADVSFVYQLAKLAGPDLGAALLETYVDVNHVSGAGSTTLLGDKTAFIQSRDAWEYAVSASAKGAYLFRSNAPGAPVALGPVALSIDADGRRARVTIPRALLRGSVARWGFVATVSAVDPASPDGARPKPLAQPRGPSILGLLAPLEQQKALAKAAGAPPRLSALRAR